MNTTEDDAKTPPLPAAAAGMAAAAGIAAAPDGRGTESDSCCEGNYVEGDKFAVNN